jgi:phosphoribosylformimino-5-aminoimidazole carboxamide ribotide isomerase
MNQSSFIVFPAIDLRAGQVVRLKEGRPDQQTNYASDPAAVAEKWLSDGARWLHVINLDGAFDQPDQANQQALRQIVTVAERFGAQIQFGGGLRSLDALDAALQMGVTRGILGTLAAEHPDLVEKAVQRWGAERVGASLDSRDGQVRVRGWQQDSGIPTAEIALRLKECGLQWLVFTDISRDGLQTGINLPATQALATGTKLKVVASGGVRGWDDIRGAASADLAGIIVGRALYEGVFNPRELFTFSA